MIIYFHLKHFIYIRFQDANFLKMIDMATKWRHAEIAWSDIAVNLKILDPRESRGQRGDDGKLIYRGYDDLLFWWTMENSSTEPTTTFFFDGDDGKLIYRGYDDLPFWRGPWKTHLPRLRRPSFLMGTMENSSTEATTTFFWGFHGTWLDSVTQNHAFCFWHAWTALYDFWNLHSWLNEKFWQFKIWY